MNNATDALLLAMADDELLLGHRDSEWTGHAPILEEDIAFANIAQDEMGHALLWYSLLHERGLGDPDRLAFFRAAGEFRNAQMVELPKGDWAFTIVRQYLFDVYEHVRNAALAQIDDEGIRAVVAKITREEVYHLMHSRGWVLRLGGATEESHRRMQAALDELWPYALGLFELAGPEGDATAIASDGGSRLRAAWLAEVAPVLAQATLAIPEGVLPKIGGRRGYHTVHLDALLAEMQKVARSEAPGTLW